MTGGASGVEIERDGPVARIVMNRPERRNALSHEMMTELLAALDVIAGDETAQACVIAGRGPAFSAGHDLVEMTANRDSAFYEELFATCVRLMTRVHELPQPVIARVHGVATAAGCQLVAACDLAIASTDATFATPGVNIGLFCSTPMVPVARAIGSKRALEMLFTGESISAATALEWGLVNRVVPGDRLDKEVDALARRIAAASPAVVALGKRAFYAQDRLTERAAYEIAAPVMVENAQADDAHEGMRAFLEKRAPQWRSR
jgi:enoyl-CoA hydratase/carnithine racemase